LFRLIFVPLSFTVSRIAESEGFEMHTELDLLVLMIAVAGACSLQHSLPLDIFGRNQRRNY
jgi:hypothetical protein